MGTRLRALDRTPAAPVAIAAIYVLLAVWGAEVAVADGLTLWYPPPGIIVAAILLGGPRFAVSAVLGELVVSLVVFEVAGDFGVGLTLVNALLVGGSYAAVGLVLRAVRLDLRIPDLRSLSILAGGLLVGAVPGALLGTTVGRWAGTLAPEDQPDAILTWFEGDAIGMLTVTPAVVLALSLPRTRGGRVPRPRLLDGWLGRLEIFSVIAVPIVTVSLLDRVDVVYLCLVPIVGVALRRAHPGSAVAGATTTAVVATALAIDGGSFDRSDIVLLLGVLALTGMVMGLLVAQRFDSSRTTVQLAAALAQTHDMVAVATFEGEPTWWNDAARRYLERDDGTVAHVHEVLLGGADRAAQIAAQVRSGERWEHEQVLLDTAGHRVEVDLVVLPDRDEREVITGYVLFARDATARRAYEAELSRRALHDELTGVANRALLQERLGQAVGRAGRTEGRSALMLLDLDRFKVVNDSLGHRAGDDLLCQMATRIQARLRSGDTLARLGGDEFTVLVEDVAGLAGIVAIAQDVLGAISDPFELEGSHVVTTGSIGIVELGEDHDPEELLRQADLAMYRAKARGGDGLAVYDRGMSDVAARRLSLEGGLRRCLDEGSIAMHFQPVVDLATGRMVLAEALLRLDLPDLGPVGPGDVIGVAAETGLMPALGRAVTEYAATRAAGWPEEFSVSVNVSPHQLRDRHLPRMVDAVTEAAGLDPRRLVLELTEEAFLEDPEHAARVLRTCRRSGVRVAIDDFGRGWSSLATLRTLPIDVLKLDRSLLDGIQDSTRARAVVQAVLAVADALELFVVAEGIETEEQLAVSREIGCSHGQGYLLARPMPETDLAGWLSPHGAAKD